MKAIYEREYLQVGLKIAYYRKLRGLTQESGLTAPQPLSVMWRPPTSARLSLWTHSLILPLCWKYQLINF